ncbi:hypothetical protein AZ78_1294 [Lysobacter capsici AZ78]|uniref:Uncharacterized protein n=1 Tax=Lysobacter capsici AZ78 TaxID=1444315 RepID=A0A108U722_9GAMM|nr:hypothetical protein AZ78_1294 [Lysobacter capsici AZ78]
MGRLGVYAAGAGALDGRDVAGLLLLRIGEERGDGDGRAALGARLGVLTLGFEGGVAFFRGNEAFRLSHAE